MQKPLLIHADWDEKASVWVAMSDDVPGLATESETLEGLSEKLQIMVPELLAANGTPKQKTSYELLARRFAIAHQGTNA